MTWFANLRKRWSRREHPPVIPVRIDGQEYAVTESARAQAEANMRHDPAKRAAVERLLQDQLGDERGKAEARRRYPGAGWTD